MPTLLGQNFIAGERSADGEQRLKSLDATNGQPLPYDFYQATESEVDRAALAAESVFVEYRQLSPARRAEFLDAIADEIDHLGEDFVAIVCQETALPAGRIQGERARTSGQMRLFAKVLRRGDYLGARIDLALPDRTPLPCLAPVISPWRFRLQVAIPLRLWRRAALWYSRLTAATWQRPTR
jgi:NADP-dependent aldehyde dehydrogenase